MTDDAAHEVRLGALIAASARAIAGAWGAFLIVWLSRGLPEAVTPLVLAAIPPGGPPPVWLQALPWLIGAVLAAVSGLYIRWLLAPGAASLRPDLRLGGYVALIVASNLLSVLAVGSLMGGLRGLDPAEALPRMALVTGTTVALDLVYAALALWPIAVLAGDGLGPVAAVKRMGQAYLAWVLVLVVLGLPSLVWAQIPLLTHQLPRSLAMRIAGLALASLTTTVSTVVLAQIYARRVRGVDLAAASDAR